MKVEVRKKDGLNDTMVGAGVTGEGGRFAVAYSTDSSADIELYLHFIAESGDGMIRVRKKGVFDKWSRNQDVLKDTPLVVLSIHRPSRRPIKATSSSIVRSSSRSSCTGRTVHVSSSSQSSAAIRRCRRTHPRRSTFSPHR